MIDILGGQRQIVPGKAYHLLAEQQGMGNLWRGLGVRQHRLQGFTLAHQRQMPFGGLAVIAKLATGKQRHSRQRDTP